MGALAWYSAKAATAAAIGAAVLLCLLAVAPLTGRTVYVVTGGSMGRAVPAGSIAVTRAIPASEIGPGDVVSFTSAGRSIVTHRVVEVGEEEGVRLFVTRGDANTTRDPIPLSPGTRVRRVDHVVPFAGYVVGFVRSPAGYIAFILLPLVGLIAPRLRRRAPVPLAG